MQVVAGKTVDDLPTIDWEESSMNCGGDVRDDAFLVDLLACFCMEGIPRLKKLLAAALAYRGGAITFAQPGDAPKAIETVIKEEAHALKGSAANVRLWKLAKACEDCEMPCKAIVQSNGYASSVDRKALLDRFCVAPGDEIRQLVQQFIAFAAFMEKDMKGLVEEGVDLATSLEPGTLDDLAHRCTGGHVQAAIEPEWTTFNSAAAAPADMSVTDVTDSAADNTAVATSSENEMAQSVSEQTAETGAATTAHWEEEHSKQAEAASPPSSEAAQAEPQPGQVVSQPSAHRPSDTAQPVTTSSSVRTTGSADAQMRTSPAAVVPVMEVLQPVPVKLPSVQDWGHMPAGTAAARPDAAAGPVVDAPALLAQQIAAEPPPRPVAAVGAES